MKKIAVLFTCFFILTTGTMLPTITSESTLHLSTNSQSYNDNFSPVPENRSDEIKNLYETVIYKMNAGLDPTIEIKSLLTFKEIQNTVSLLDGNESIERIHMIFSNRPSIVKNLFFTRELIKDRTRESEPYNEIHDFFNTTILYELESVDDIYELEIVQALNLSKSQLFQLYDHWHNFLLQNPSVAKLFEFDNPDLVILFLIFFACLFVYVFVLNGMLATVITADMLLILTLSIGALEAFLFGLGMTILMAEIRPINDLSITNLIAEFLISIIPPLGIYKAGIEAMISYSFGLLFLGLFLSIYMFVPLIRFFCASLFSIGINAIASLFFFFIYKIFIENIRPVSSFNHMNFFSV